MTVNEFLAQMQAAIAANPAVGSYAMCVEGPRIVPEHQPAAGAGFTFDCAGFMVAPEESFAYARLKPSRIEFYVALSTLDPPLALE